MTKQQIVDSVVSDIKSKIAALKGLPRGIEGKLEHKVNQHFQITEDAINILKSEGVDIYGSFIHIRKGLELNIYSD